MKAFSTTAKNLSSSNFVADAASVRGRILAFSRGDAASVRGRILAPSRDDAGCVAHDRWDSQRPSLISHSGAKGGVSRRLFLLGGLHAAVAACSGCLTGRQQQVVTLPERHSVRSEQLRILSDFELQGDHPLIADLKQLRNQVTQTLDLPVHREPVVVYLFSNELTYRQYIEATYPQFPPRRAYFVGTSKKLAVYTFWGNRIQEDLRHEFTHGLLHSCHKRVPLWLDEGLAEYFEVAGPGPGGINGDYGQRLVNAMAIGWRPDISRLEKMDEFSQMQQADYQEAWAWMHFLLHSSPQSKQILLDYLKDLRSNPHPTGLIARLERGLPEFEQQFMAYLPTLNPPQTQISSR